jgi:hypothetical protein
MGDNTLHSSSPSGIVLGCWDMINGVIVAENPSVKKINYAIVSSHLAPGKCLGLMNPKIAATQAGLCQIVAGIISMMRFSMAFLERCFGPDNASESAGSQDGVAQKEISNGIKLLKEVLHSGSSHSFSICSQRRRLVESKLNMGESMRAVRRLKESTLMRRVHIWSRGRIESLTNTRRSKWSSLKYNLASNHTGQ